MPEALISLVFYLILAGVIWWAISRIVAVIPLPEPIRTIVDVIMVVILVLIVLYALLPLVHSIHLPR